MDTCYQYQTISDIIGTKFNKKKEYYNRRQSKGKNGKENIKNQRRDSITNICYLML